MNAPAVNDGRELEIQRNIPEPINLLYDDIVNDDVVTHLLADNIPSDTAKHLQKMPLSKFSVSVVQMFLTRVCIWIQHHCW